MIVELRFKSFNRDMIRQYIIKIIEKIVIGILFVLANDSDSVGFLVLHWH